jgi:hypothetical protein
MRQRRWWLVVATFALVLAWMVAPAAIPIYDGIGNPDEPYRYLNPPASAKTTKTPGDARVVVAMSGGSSTAQYANTGESGPQLSLYMPPKALTASATTKAITVTVKPLAPSAPLPRDGKIVTNVYHLAATADDGHAVEVVGSGPSEPSLQMRAPDGRQPGPVFEHRTPTGWERARTIRIKFDVYQAQAPALGDWALVQLTSGASSSDKGGGIKWGLLGPGIALLALAAVVLMVRMRRTSGTAYDG